MQNTGQTILRCDFYITERNTYDLNEEKQNNPLQEEKPYQDNSNVYNNKINNDIILQLKKEIASLKSEQNNLI